MKLSQAFLQKALPTSSCFIGSKPLSYDLLDTYFDVQDTGISFDTRSLRQGDFFIPLRGEHTDGHNFLQKALELGACGALIAQDKESFFKALPEELTQGKLFILVHDTTQALIDLAKARRGELTCPVVGITGSVGKTSTKEMLGNILKQAGLNAYVSHKNFNSVYGVCYNLLMMPDNLDAVVLEMGISVKGEMYQNASIVRPDFAVITMIGHAHMEGLGGTIQGVSHEKRQIFSFFGPEHIGIINGDQEELNLVYNHHVARFGYKTKNQVQARRVRVVADEHHNLTTVFTLKWYKESARITLNGNHRGMLTNALAAAAAAYLLKVSFAAVVRGIQTYAGFQDRFELTRIKNSRGLVINDCYNANPESMKAALLAFDEMNQPLRKVAVLGDMLELGPRELFWHRQVGKIVAKVKDLHELILVGKRSSEMIKVLPPGLVVHTVESWELAIPTLQQLLDQQPSLVLVKASRGIQLDKIVQVIAEK